MLIGEVARRTGIQAGTIRFYEREKLVTPPARSPAGYRLYSDRTIAEIGFIKKARRIGFSLDDIRDVLRLGRSGRMPCDRVVKACDSHLREIDQRMGELRQYRARLQKARRQAQAGCGFTPEGFCRAILGT